jgi:hypothetical protein
MLKPVWGFSVGAYAYYDDWRGFYYCGGTHYFFAEVGAAFSVFYGEDVGHSRLVTCEA